MESGYDRRHVGIQDGKGQEQMKIRNAGLEDLPEILKLYAEARAFMQRLEMPLSGEAPIRRHSW